MSSHSTLTSSTSLSREFTCYNNPRFPHAFLWVATITFHCYFKWTHAVNVNELSKISSECYFIEYFSCQQKLYSLAILWLWFWLGQLIMTDELSSRLKLLYMGFKDLLLFWLALFCFNECWMSVCRLGALSFLFLLKLQNNLNFDRGRGNGYYF